MTKTTVKKPAEPIEAAPKAAEAKTQSTETSAAPKPAKARPKAAPAVVPAKADVLKKAPASPKAAPAKPAAVKSKASALNGAATKPIPKAGASVPQAKAKPAAEPKEKVRKPKLVRDSFTMPEAEYEVLADVKKACLKAGVAVKKSELLRVGVALIKTLEVAKLAEAVAALAPLKAGRPKKDAK